MRVEIMAWEQAEPQAAHIRFTIFMQEPDASGVELDAQDKDCVHALAYDDAGKAIGTGRMFPDGQIGRMAVVKEQRSSGVGAALLEALVNEARKRGLDAVRVSAPVQTLDFYRDHGFVADGKMQAVGNGAIEQPMKKPLGG